MERRRRRERPEEEEWSHQKILQRACALNAQLQNYDFLRGNPDVDNRERHVKEIRGNIRQLEKNLRRQIKKRGG